MPPGFPESVPDPEARRPPAEALAEVGRLLAQSLEPEEVAQRIVDSVRALLRGRLAVLYRLADSGDLVALAESGDTHGAYTRGMVIPAETGAVGLTVEQRRPVATPDMLVDPRVRMTPEARARVERARHRAVLAVPLLVQDRVIGALSVGDRAGRDFTAEEIALAGAFADQAALALENARLYAEAQRGRRDAEELARVARTLTESLDVAAVGERIVDSVLPILGLTSAALRLLAPEGLVGVAWAGTAREHFRPGHVVPPGAGIVGRAAAEGRPVWSADVMSDDKVVLTPEMRELNVTVGARAVLAVPLRVKGRVIGVLSVADQAVRPFSPHEVTLLQAFGDQVALALENARLYAEAERRRREAEAASRAKDEHLAMLGHELRNPLGAIRAAAAALDTVGAQDQPSRRLRGIVTRQAQHLARLVDDLLEVARLQSGKIVLQPRPVELKAAAEQCVESLRQAGRAQRQVVSVAGESVLVQGDPVRLEQAIANLLDNALKYTPAGGRVDVTVGLESDRAVVRVRDTGLGIEAEILPRIFDAFIQGERSLARAEGGLGLGLTLVRQIAELHGGAVGAFSAGRGQGSEFAIWLPLASAPVATREPGPALAARPRRHILVIEDNDDAREALRMWLELEGHRVDVAADGPRGLELALASSPEIALIDIGLPGIDGYEVARRLRAQPWRRTPYLVAVTGYGQVAARRDALEAGFDAYLVKPADPAELARILEGAGPAAAGAKRPSPRRQDLP